MNQKAQTLATLSSVVEHTHQTVVAVCDTHYVLLELSSGRHHPLTHIKAFTLKGGGYVAFHGASDQNLFIP